MQGFDIVGYAYDGACHCPDCARADGMDGERSVDHDGNPVHPIFVIEANTNPDETCDDCGERLFD